MPEQKKTPGELAYDGYRDHTSGKTWNGYDMPLWAALPPAVRLAWEAGAQAVRGETLAEVITMLKGEVPA